jgi:tocopherol O-methyltransferase
MQNPLKFPATRRTIRFTRDEIAAYYDTHQAAYSRFWSRAALHYGLWYPDTKTLAEAVENTNKFIVDILGLEAKDMVLDAGCGVGGTSICIAETTGAQVVGITVSDVQLRIAKRSARQVGLSDRLTFFLQDYTCIDFPDATFSKVFGIESVCYAENKADFLMEAYRVLSPGGRIAVIDAFLRNEELSAAEARIYDKFRIGWVVPNLVSVSKFRQLLEKENFKDIQFIDMHRYIERSVRRIFLCSLVTTPVNFVTSRLGLARENFAARFQKPLFEGIATYGIFIAEKPLH